MPHQLRLLTVSPSFPEATGRSLHHKAGRGIPVEPLWRSRLRH
ncbi:MAG: hypothetical protein QM715_21355 [Nibricoccus sp.]